MHMDKSNIYFSNGKKIVGKRSMECKQNNWVFSEKKNQTPVRGQDGKISDTRRKDFYYSPNRGASLETSNLSLGCLRFFRLALFPVLDPLCLFPPQLKVCQYEFTTEAFYVLLVFFLGGGWVGGGKRF